VAKTNYLQLRRQKEAARKIRRQSKLDRRTQERSEESAVAPEAMPAVVSPPEGSSALA
jgi:hypothetical protein